MKKIRTSFLKKFRSLSLSTQIFFIIISFILILILLQALIYSVLFEGFYYESKIENIQENVSMYVNELKEVEDDDYFTTIKNYTDATKSYSIILDNEFNKIKSGSSHYKIVVTNPTTFEEYIIKLPEPIETIKTEMRVQALIMESGTEYDVFKLTIYNEDIFNQPCSSDCIEVSGMITDIIIPKNMNYDFGEYQIVTTELYYLKSLDTQDILDTTCTTLNEDQYRCVNPKTDNLIFVHDINSNHKVMNLYIMESSDDVLDILSAYNLSIYVAMIVLALTISFIVSNLISKPIVSIDKVAQEISNLNFDISANEYQNKETSSLTKNINTIAVNLKNNIDQLYKRNKEVTSLYEEQTRQVELRKRFISAISHELKTPLMVMNITVQGILDGIFSGDETEEELHRVLAEITTTDVLIKDLLDIFKLDDLIIKEYEEINLKNVTQTVLNSVENLTKQYKQTVSLNTVRSPIIYGDPKLMSMVVSNLITNAIKYTPENERIIIDISSRKNEITFRVTNYGVTIPSDSLEHLYEPFYRVDKSRTKTTKSKGTGLGLYIVSETLKAHEFKFGIENIENGVTAWFTAVKNKKNNNTRQ